MTAKTTRNARSRTQRGQARAALEAQRRKVKLQEDHLTALFTHLEEIDRARLQAGEQVSQLRELGLTLGEIAELTGEPVNRLSRLSRMSTDDGDNDAEDTVEAGGEEASLGRTSAGDEDTDPTEAGTDENQDGPSSSSAAGENETSSARLKV